MKVFKKILKKILIIVNTIKYVMRIINNVLRTAQNLGGLTPLKIIFQKFGGGWRPPQACRWETPWFEPTTSCIRGKRLIADHEGLTVMNKQQRGKYIKSIFLQRHLPETIWYMKETPEIILN